MVADDWLVGDLVGGLVGGLVDEGEEVDGSVGWLNLVGPWWKSCSPTNVRH